LKINPGPTEGRDLDTILRRADAGDMAKKPKRLPRDVNQLAKSIVDLATSEAAPEPETANDGKNPAAVALGRLGGLKGGKARAKKLSKKRLSESARKAARARWSKH
jgi:hypothetical protein